MENFTLFASLATAIVLEAAPFLLLGSLVGALFEVFVSDTFIERMTPRTLPGRLCFGLFAGMLLPTCECGVVPVVRKLLSRGIPPATAITYLFSAPVINPVVLLSTYFAFQSDMTMVFWRAILVAIPALILGGVMGSFRAVDLLNPPRAVLHRMGETEHHEHECGCASCGQAHAESSRLHAVLIHTGLEFLAMSKFLIAGACAAALFKTFTPSTVLDFFQGSSIISVASMMLFAILSSVCSEADAFVAAGFTMLPKAAMLSFVAIGPMVDLKLIPMFLSTFKRRVALAMVVVPVFTVFFLCAILAFVETQA